jgi:predicted transcriptional regulator/predicted RNA binding protein YcfA (HicA-like mRNA interferase family)
MANRRIARKHSKSRQRCVAAALDRDRTYVINQALDVFLEVHEWQVAHIPAAKGESDAGGPFIAHEDMMRWIDPLETEGELPPPASTIIAARPDLTAITLTAGRPAPSSVGQALLDTCRASLNTALWTAGTAMMAAIETNTRKIVARLEREGWRKVGGRKHDRFEHPARPGVRIIVPRHRELSIGVARGIAKDAGWL